MKEKCSCLHQVKKGMPSVETKSTLTKFSARVQYKIPKHDSCITSLMKPHKTQSTSALTALMWPKDTYLQNGKTGQKSQVLHTNCRPPFLPSDHPQKDCIQGWSAMVGGGVPMQVGKATLGAIGWASPGHSG